jgi:hypothetical protein
MTAADATGGRVYMALIASTHSKLVCRARIVSDVHLNRGRTLGIASSKAIICVVSNSEPIGRTESLRSELERERDQARIRASAFSVATPARASA